MKKQGVTSRDVARRAGVSQASVSRAFTPGSSLSEDKRRRILDAADALNYIPNSIASSLNTARTNTIGLVIGDTDNPFYVHVLRAFMRALQARGQQALTFTTEPGGSSDEAIRAVLRYRVDAIVLTAAQLSTRGVSLCKARGIPIILFNRYVPGLDVPVVRCDNVGGGAQIADLLYTAGARSFAVVKGDPLGTTSADRVDGFKARLAAYGVDASRIAEIEAGSTYDGAYSACRSAFLSRDVALPDALFGVNDIMAMAAMDVLRHDMEKNVPGDIMVAGFDNIPESARASYALTTLDQPIDAMVTETLNVLDLSLSGGDELPAQKVLSSDVVWRKTVRAAL